MTDEKAKEICDQIREQSWDLHQWLRHGHLKKVYENGLRNHIRRLGLQVEQQPPVQVHDRDGSILGDFLADLFVEDELIIELKACKAIAEEHVAKILGYLRASGKRHELFINFGVSQFQIKKYVL